MVEYDRVQAEVNLNNIYGNVVNLKKLVNPMSKVMVIIKADGYGHGASAIVDCLDGIVDAYGVAMIDEAVTLRENGCSKMLLILGYTPENYLPMVVKYGISQTVFDYETALILSKAAVSQKTLARVHIKLDTGMGRIGFKCNDEDAEVIKKISGLPGIRLEGCFTHFAKADEKDLGYTRQQFRTYMDFTDRLHGMGVIFEIQHVCNSAAVMQFPEANLDMVRFGIATYGLYPSEDVDKNIVELKPGMSIRSVVSFVKEVEAGTHISYGGIYEAPSKRMIATVPVGYADGYPRAQSNVGRVLVHGKNAPIVGRVCMDQFMIDVTDIPDVCREDVVTLVGSDGNECISVEEVAAAAGSFNYEFVCNVGKRVPRTYIK